MALGLQTSFAIFAGARPDNSLERFTKRSIGLVTDRPSYVYQLLVPLLRSDQYQQIVNAGGLQLPRSAFLRTNAKSREGGF